MSNRLYPHDCSAECARLSEWDFDYQNKYWPHVKEHMGACGLHKEDIQKAVEISAKTGTIQIIPHTV